MTPISHIIVVMYCGVVWEQILPEGTACLGFTPRDHTEPRTRLPKGDITVTLQLEQGRN